MTTYMTRDQRIEIIVQLMREHGPMTIPQIATATGRHREHTRDLIKFGLDKVFECITPAVKSPVDGVSAAVYFLVGVEVDEEQAERTADAMSRDYGKWWPKADVLVMSSMAQMVRMGRQA